MIFLLNEKNIKNKNRWEESVFRLRRAGPTTLLSDDSNWTKIFQIYSEFDLHDSSSIQDKQNVQIETKGKFK